MSLLVASIKGIRIVIWTYPVNTGPDLKVNVSTGLHVIVLTEILYLRQSNPVFSMDSKTPWRLQRRVSFSGVASKLMDAKSESSRKLSREINKMARVQEEKERQQMREKEVAKEKEKRKKEEEFDRSVITRKLSIFGSYRRMSFRIKDTMSEEVSNGWAARNPPPPSHQPVSLREGRKMRDPRNGVAPPSPLIALYLIRYQSTPPSSRGSTIMGQFPLSTFCDVTIYRVLVCSLVTEYFFTLMSRLVLEVK